MGMLAGKVMLLGTAGMQSIFLWDGHALSSELILSFRAGQSGSISPISRPSVDGNRWEAEPVCGNPTLPSAVNTSASLLPFTRKSSSPFLHKKNVSNAGEIWDEAQ